MQLNLPIMERLSGCQNILIAGAGGGFDIFLGLPLYFALRAAGKTVHLANYSFTDIDAVKFSSGHEILIADLLVGARGTVELDWPYFPEGFLAQWFKDVCDEDVPIWMFLRSGPGYLREAYEHLIMHLGGIDALILVDGGVDSLMRGDEEGSGTILEDFISLTAVDALDIPTKILACVGFGAEIGDALCHYRTLENIAGLAQVGAFFGCCALTAEMDVYQRYEAASRYVWEQPYHSKGHIGTQVVAAVNGQFGNQHLYKDDFSNQVQIAVSPLMSLYWFFNARAVIHRNLMIEALRPAWTKSQALAALAEQLKRLRLRPCKSLPY